MTGTRTGLSLKRGAIALFMVLVAWGGAPADAENRLWVRAYSECEPSQRLLGLGEAFIADLVASGIGALVQTAADRLIAADEYVLKTTLAFQPAFVWGANAKAPDLYTKCIVLNVGDSAVPVTDGNGQLLTTDEFQATEQYRTSSVVVRIELMTSDDGTALGGRVTDWKYVAFLDPSPTPFRAPRHKVTIEVKMLDLDATPLIALAMQIEATSRTLAETRPNAGEQLPWIKRPTKSPPGDRDPTTDYRYGPVNIEAKITEVAEPSGFAKVLGSTLSNQKGAIEAYVKERVTQALDESAAATAKLALLNAASTARDQYETVYTAAATARAAYDAAPPPKTKERQALVIKLGILKQNEVLARAAFDKAGLAFESLPVIAEP